MSRTVNVKSTGKKPYAKKTIEPASNVPNALPFVTIEEVKLGDILVQVDSSGAICSLNILGVVDKINVKSVRIKLLKVDASTLHLVSVTRYRKNQTYSIVSDSIYLNKRLKYSVADIRDKYAPAGKDYSGRKDTMTLSTVKNGVLAHSSARYKFYTNDVLFPEHCAGDEWKDDAEIRRRMESAEDDVKKLLDEDYRKTQEMKVSVSVTDLSGNPV